MEPAIGRDDEGRLIFWDWGTGEGYYNVRLYNHRGWVFFENGEPTAYGIILRTRRFGPKGIRLKFNTHRQSYILRMFEPTLQDSEQVLTVSDLESIVWEWNEETQTGIKIISLTKLKLRQHDADYACPVPLTSFYLGKYHPRDNPYQFGYEARSKVWTPGIPRINWQVKIRQTRIRKSFSCIPLNSKV